MSAASRLKKVSHVIFDMDGVLIDTEKLYTKSTQNVVLQFGKTFQWSHKAQLMGLPGPDSAKKLVQLLDLPITWEEYYDLVQKEYAKVMLETELIPGAERLVKHLKRHDVPIAIATSSSQDSFELKTRKYRDLFRLFNHVVCGGSDPEVKEGKPKPDVFLVCASRFVPKPTPEDCLVVEDAPNGVKAALSAGMQVVMIPDENIPEEMRKDAHWVVNSLEDIPLEKFGLPALK